jgi:hypothetical protein
MTGEQMQTDIYIGPTYYMRLKHMVKDKINYRARGPRTVLTRQTVQGRANDGGLRIGEMERDGVIAHGASAFLEQSLMLRGDEYYMAVCNNTGTVAVYNASQNLFLSPMADGPVKFSGTLSDKLNIENVSKYGRSFSIVRVPYSLKLLIQELQGLNIQLRIITEDNIDQLTNMSYSDNLRKQLKLNDNVSNNLLANAFNNEIPKVIIDKSKQIIAPSTLPSKPTDIDKYDELSLEDAVSPRYPPPEDGIEETLWSNLYSNLERKYPNLNNKQYSNLIKFIYNNNTYNEFLNDIYEIPLDSLLNIITTDSSLGPKKTLTNQQLNDEIYEFLRKRRILPPMFDKGRPNDLTTFLQSVKERNEPIPNIYSQLSNYVKQIANNSGNKINDNEVRLYTLGILELSGIIPSTFGYDSLLNEYLQSQIEPQIQKQIQQVTPITSSSESSSPYIPTGFAPPQFSPLSSQGSPGYGPVSPEYAPVSPGYGPVSPEYGPVSPGYAPVSPGYGPVSPDYNIASPIYTAQQPQFTGVKLQEGGDISTIPLVDINNLAEKVAEKVSEKVSEIKVESNNNNTDKEDKLKSKSILMNIDDGENKEKNESSSEKKQISFQL